MLVKASKQAKHFEKPKHCRNIEYIVIHYPGNTATASKQCAYYSHCTRVVSAHYVINDETIFECLDPKFIAFHVVSSGKCRNENAIGIDLEAHKLNTASCKASDLDWYHSQSTLNTAAKFIAYLMIKYEIPIENVLRHYDVTKKKCPASLCGNGINEVYKMSGNAAWDKFKGLIQAEYDSIINNHIKSLALFEV